jgi:lysophospholipase L1-like esterase
MIFAILLALVNPTRPEPVTLQRAERLARIDAPTLLPAALLGDSIVDWNRTALADQLAACGIPVAIHARATRRIADVNGVVVSGVTAIEAVLDRGAPARWIVVLGSNDALYVTSPIEARAKVTELLRSIPTGAEITWVGVHVVGFEEASSWINAAVAERGVPLVHWAEPALLEDFVHPNAAGVAALAAAICDT